MAVFTVRFFQAEYVGHSSLQLLHHFFPENFFGIFRVHTGHDLIVDPDRDPLLAFPQAERCTEVDLFRKLVLCDHPFKDIDNIVGTFEVA